MISHRATPRPRRQVAARFLGAPTLIICAPLFFRFGCAGPLRTAVGRTPTPTVAAGGPGAGRGQGRGRLGSGAGRT